ncbi:hypothetical protein [Aureimonas leprariae]|uniref:ParB/Sulfiredoxin domain-containing protein n=1 Tax=Plantimonas leprariae TaxID=2615207 RepID=A0A7V7TXR8_9HYPH|nr:hypothetical protein [Aureimonas leprariae]KAB0682029.1 hypothetical protein F6X38_04290 [Aureimonas leprariae]
MTLRSILPIDVTSLSPGAPATGMPIFELVDPRTLFVDEAYQRQISERGQRQIRRIVEGFDWTKFTPPVCAYSEDENGRTVLKVIDGQHCATAAASNPFVSEIPVQIVEAPDTEAQAKAFIGQNTDRLGVTKPQMFVASLAAGDEDAKTMAEVCARAGVRIRRMPPAGGSSYEPGESMSVAAIAALLKKGGAEHAKQVLTILARARLAPIKADHIKAVDALLTDPQFGTIDPEALPAHIEAQGTGALSEATVLAYSHTIPLWKGLAAVWFKKARKLRGGKPAQQSGLEAGDAGTQREGGAALAPAPGEPVRAPSHGYFANAQARREEPVGVGRQAEALTGGPEALTARPSSLPDDLVPDKRPALKGWRPGNQTCRCRQCDRRFVGGPGAKQCAPCAYGDDDEAR